MVREIGAVGSLETQRAELWEAVCGQVFSAVESSRSRQEIIGTEREPDCEELRSEWKWKDDGSCVPALC